MVANMTQAQSRVTMWLVGVLLVFAMAFAQSVRAQECSVDAQDDIVSQQSSCTSDVAADDRFTDVASASAVQTSADNDAQHVWTVLGALVVVIALIVLIDRSGKRARAESIASSDT